MPILDMPLEQLKNYNGVNPCPPDIDEFWDRAISEMKSTDPNLELIPASFQTDMAECFDMYFTGVGGARIHAKYLRPRKDKALVKAAIKASIKALVKASFRDSDAPSTNTSDMASETVSINASETASAKASTKASAIKHPAVVQFHGYSVNCGDWQSKLNFISLGYSVAALDCRGQGGYSEDKGGVIGNTYKGHIIRGLDEASPDKLLFRQIFLDTAQLAGIMMTMPEVDPDRVGAMGGSQGGALTIACSALEPRIKRLAPAFPFLSDYKRVWEMDLAKGAYEEIRTYFRQFDPLHARENEIFTKLGYIDIQHIAKRIRGEVLLGIGFMDDICPPSTQFAAYNKITAPKNMAIYPDFGHEVLPEFDDMTFQFLAGL
ncbi:MAG: acetylxylan esterase [Clostridiales bacterium]|nr:acetylxylan esterase [Clostridiales bacterium]